MNIRQGPPLPTIPSNTNRSRTADLNQTFVPTLEIADLKEPSRKPEVKRR